MPETPLLGDRIRARRVGLGLTLATVAQRADLSLPYVSNLERGRGNPTLDALRAIAAALDMPLGDLVTDGEQSAGGDLTLAQAPPSLLQFAKTPRFQSAVRRLAEEHSCSQDEMRQRLLIGMVSAPRRSTGEPNEEDWRRLLDVYSLILADE
ncbi:MAG: helix-turn-helix transcriptional regulator [Actinobacteria bacterium]|nr:helix-turn-helix transcriptional regulator [Actinomycetota bacterium]